LVELVIDRTHARLRLPDLVWHEVRERDHPDRPGVLRAHRAAVALAAAAPVALEPGRVARLAAKREPLAIGRPDGPKIDDVLVVRDQHGRARSEVADLDSATTLVGNLFPVRREAHTGARAEEE
jgi:hypothetical protein